MFGKLNCDRDLFSLVPSTFLSNRGICKIIGKGAIPLPFHYVMIFMSFYAFWIFPKLIHTPCYEKWYGMSVFKVIYPNQTLLARHKASGFEETSFGFLCFFGHIVDTITKWFIPIHIRITIFLSVFYGICVYQAKLTHFTFIKIFLLNIVISNFVAVHYILFCFRFFCSIFLKYAVFSQNV